MNSNHCPLTIIIPTYNEEKKIEDTIRSVKNQKTNLKYEAIVCDGGSSDKTVEIAQKYMKVIKSPKKGKVSQINYAVKQSNGKILVFVDADTILPYNYFQMIYNEFKKDKNLFACSAPHIYQNKRLVSPGVIFWSLILIFLSPLVFSILTIYQIMFYLYFWDKRIRPITMYYPLSQVLFIYFLGRAFFNFTEFSGSNMCIRRSIFEKIGGLKPAPNSKGTDAIFSAALRKFCRFNRGHIKILSNLAVLTDPRFISHKRIMNRLHQPKKIAKFYEKIVNNDNNNKTIKEA